MSKDTILLTFATPDTTKPLNLPTCSCILAQGGRDDNGDPVVRPYTPISTNSEVGNFTLMVRIYPSGILSTHMSTMQVGDVLSFKHIDFNVKKQYPFYPSGCDALVMIVGGTGITPMIQALHAVLGNGEDKIKRVFMIYGSKDEEGILAKDTLESWSSTSSNKFTITHVLSQEPSGTGYKGRRGVIDREIIEEVVPGPGEDVKIWVCGPEGMYDSICGPRGDDNVSGVLGSLGYSKEQVRMEKN